MYLRRRYAERMAMEEVMIAEFLVFTGWQVDSGVVVGYGSSSSSSDDGGGRIGFII